MSTNAMQGARYQYLPSEHQMTAMPTSATSDYVHQIAASLSIQRDSESSVVGPSQNRSARTRVAPSHKLDYELPPTITSLKDGWMWKCQSGAVVSGLLASVAAQLLTPFSTPPPNQCSPTPQGAQDFLLISCYIAIFFNINATIGSFILIYKLAEIGFKTSANIPFCDPEQRQVAEVICTPEELLEKYNASKMWRPMVWFWLFNFFVGVISLILSIMIYVFIQGSITMQRTLGIAVCFDTFVLFYFIVANVLAD